MRGDFAPGLVLVDGVSVLMRLEGRGIVGAAAVSADPKVGAAQGSLRAMVRVDGRPEEVSEACDK